jgi:prepilin-type N-terminal cleavage/methylation domain-containing protein
MSNSLSKNTSKGFSLLELLVVIALIGLLSSIVLVAVNKARIRSHNTQRIHDMTQIQLALELYYQKHGAYPEGDHVGFGTGDTPGNGTFIQPLVDEGYLPKVFKDPITNAPGNDGNYWYNHYNGPTSLGWLYNGNCAGKSWYVLGIWDLPESTGPYPSSPGFKCAGGTDQRDWYADDGFEWVTGKFD